MLEEARDAYDERESLAPLSDEEDCAEKSSEW